MQSQSY